MNRNLTFEGECFDSAKEYRRYCELRLLEKAGAIRDLKRQVKFVLIPEQREYTKEIYTKGRNKGRFKKGKLLERETAYIADFTYFDCEAMKPVVEDVKGYRGGGAYAVFTIKRKLMLFKYGIRIKEV